MPTLTIITFEGGLFTGRFTLHNHSYAGHLSVVRPGQASASVVHVRPDDEVAINLRAAFDTDDALAAIDDRLAGTPIIRTSRLLADAIAWRDMPQHDHDPQRNRPHHVFLRVYLTFRADTPAYCDPAVCGDISYYVALALDDARRFRAWVEGWSFHFDGGAWCAKAIEDALGSAVPHAVDLVQGLVDQALSAVQGLPFQTLYLLPGSGTRAPGAHHGACDAGAALALIPMREEWR
jgi:hypothetical protein